MNEQTLVTTLFGVTYKRVINESGIGDYYVNDIEVDYFELSISEGSYVITIVPKRIIK